MKEFAVIVSIHLKPGKQAEFLGPLMPVIDAVRRESTFVNNFLVEIWRPLCVDFADQRVPKGSYTRPFGFNAVRVWEAIRSFRDYQSMG